MTANSAVILLAREIAELSRSVHRCRALVNEESIDAVIVANMLARIDAMVDELRNELGPG
ncbi:MAG: hypothetical protein ACRDOU_00965 [Streptosporangiaceae bacterium]